MKAIPLILTATIVCLSVGPPAQARKKAPIVRNCDVSYNEEGRSWTVEESVGLYARWSLRTTQTSFVQSHVWLNSKAEAAAFLEGKYASKQNDTVYLSPMRPIPFEGAWLTLRGNGASFGPVHYGNSKYGRSSVEIPREQFFQMAGGEKNLTMIVQRQDGTVLIQEKMLASQFRDMETKLILLVREIETKLRDRENQCGEVIIVH